MNKMIINLSDWDYKFIDFIKDSYNFYYKQRKSQ